MKYWRLQSYILSITTETDTQDVASEHREMLQSYILSITTETIVTLCGREIDAGLQSYILSITEAHTIAGIHTKRASKHPCM